MSANTNVIDSPGTKQCDAYRIWLRDVAAVLNTQNPNPATPYYLHGFDISSAQFQPVPTLNNAEVQLSVQNCLEPFPRAHHGRYDFVHVRLLLGALRTGEYELALKNIFDILSTNLQGHNCSLNRVTNLLYRTRWLLSVGRNQPEHLRIRYIPPTTKHRRSPPYRSRCNGKVGFVLNARKAHQERSAACRFWRSLR